EACTCGEGFVELLAGLAGTDAGLCAAVPLLRGRAGEGLGFVVGGVVVVAGGVAGAGSVAAGASGCAGCGCGSVVACGAGAGGGTAGFFLWHPASSNTAATASTVMCERFMRAPSLTLAPVTTAPPLLLAP